MLSICIVNWNNRDYLRECLASIRACPPEDEPVETIVVDNASADESAEMVRSEFPEARLIASAENTGYAAGNNIALAAASGDMLLLLNPDVRLLSGSLDAALARIRADREIGAASVLFRNPDGTVQPSLRGFPDPESLLWEVTGFSRLCRANRKLSAYFMRWFEYDRPILAEQPMGTFLMVSREALSSVGLLDEQFPIFFNEVDWCYRAVELGWKIAFTPLGEIVHYGGQGTRLAARPAMTSESHRSLIRFYEKHYQARLNPRLYRLIVAAIGASQAIRSRAF